MLCTYKYGMYTCTCTGYRFCLNYMDHNMIWAAQSMYKATKQCKEHCSFLSIYRGGRRLWGISGGSRILKRGVPVWTWLIAKSAQSAHAIGGCCTWGTCPPRGKSWFYIDLLRSFLVPFWGETARVGWPTAKSSHCAWSQTKRSHNLQCSRAREPT